MSKTMLIDQDTVEIQMEPAEKRCRQCGGIYGEAEELLADGYAADELCYCFDEADFSGSSDELGYAPDR